MRLSLILLVISFNLPGTGCSQQSKDSSFQGLNFTTEGTYAELKTSIETDRNYFNGRWSKKDTAGLLDSTRQYLTNTLINKIIPFWYGTEWDFYGHTATPNQGEIACGYFVSTTLKDLGFDLNRYTMAQQAALHEAKTLQPKGKLLDYRLIGNMTFEKMLTSLKENLGDGIYLVGLDNHVGFLLKHQGELFFVHSDYVSDKVRIEPVTTSQAFSSAYYVFADITHNDDLVLKWIKNEKITVVKP